jgi:hypothetical protein
MTNKESEIKKMKDDYAGMLVDVISKNIHVFINDGVYLSKIKKEDADGLIMHRMIYDTDLAADVMCSSGTIISDVLELCNDKNKTKRDLVMHVKEEAYREISEIIEEDIQDAMDLYHVDQRDGNDNSMFCGYKNDLVQ